MATKISPPSDYNLLLIQLRNEMEDKFTDLHQMLDVRRQQLLDKLTELEEMYNKYVKHAEAINNLKLAIANIQQTCSDAMLADTQKTILPIFQSKLENLEKVNVKDINIQCLRLICNKTEIQHYINSISISDSKLVSEFTNRTAPILSKVNRGTDKGKINHPHGICIDDDVTEVYILDYNSAHGSRIHVFSLEGVFIREFGKDHLKSPHSIALSSSDVFVTNSIESHCLMKFNKAGTFVKKAGSKGIGNRQFNWPQGLCVADASVFVCDFHNNRIQVFDFNLCYLFKFTSECLTNPQGIKHYSNQLYVSKQIGSTIFVYTLEGAYIRSIQLTGEGSPLTKAHSFTMDTVGNYLITESNSNCIKIFSPTGEHVASLGGNYLQTPRGLAVDKQGLIVCVCLKDGAVFQIY